MLSVLATGSLLLRPLRQLHPLPQQPRSARLVACAESAFRALPPAEKRDVAAELYVAVSSATSEIAADATPPTPMRPLVALTVNKDGGLTLVGEHVQNITSGLPPTRPPALPSPCTGPEYSPSHYPTSHRLPLVVIRRQHGWPHVDAPARDPFAPQRTRSLARHRHVLRRRVSVESHRLLVARLRPRGAPPARHVCADAPRAARCLPRRARGAPAAGRRRRRGRGRRRGPRGAR